MKETLNYENKIVKRELSSEPLLWEEVDNNFKYGNTWETGVTYNTGMVVLWNDHLEPTFNENGCLSYWICTLQHTSSFTNVPGSGNTHWDVIYNPNADTLEGSGSTYYLYNSFRNLVSNQVYSSGITGYQYTDGFKLLSNNTKTIPFRRNDTISSNGSKIKSNGYYSVSFWYKVENYLYDPISTINIDVDINDVPIGTISFNSNVTWSFWSKTIFIDNNIDISGFLDFNGSFECDITISDLVVSRSTSPSQSYFPSPDDLITYHPNGNVNIGTDFIPESLLTLSSNLTGTDLNGGNVISLEPNINLNYSGAGLLRNVKNIDSSILISNTDYQSQEYRTVNNNKSTISISTNEFGSIILNSVANYRTGGINFGGFGTINVNNVYSFYSEGNNFSGNGDALNSYGLYLSPSYGFINNYGIYQEDPNAKNVLMGELQIGDDFTISKDANTWTINAEKDDTNINTLLIKTGSETFLKMGYNSDNESYNDMVIGSGGNVTISGSSVTLSMGNGNIFANNKTITSLEISQLDGILTGKTIQTQIDDIKSLIPKLNIITTGYGGADIYVKHELLSSSLLSLNPKIVLMHKVKNRYHKNESNQTLRYNNWVYYNSNLMSRVLTPNFYTYSLTIPSTEGQNPFNYGSYDATFYRQFNPNIGEKEVQLSLYNVVNTTLPYTPSLTLSPSLIYTLDNKLTLKNIVGHRIYKKTLKSDGTFLSLTFFNDRKKKTLITQNTELYSHLSSWELKHGKTIKKNRNLVINNYGLCIRIDDISNPGKYIYGEVCKFGISVNPKDSNGEKYGVRIII